MKTISKFTQISQSVKPGTYSSEFPVQPSAPTVIVSLKLAGLHATKAAAVQYKLSATGNWFTWTPGIVTTDTTAVLDAPLFIRVQNTGGDDVLIEGKGNA